MSTLDDKARERLIALLGMLGSAHAGERDAAARQAEALRRKLGMSWAEMIGKTVYLQPGEKTVYVDREVVVEKEVVRTEVVTEPWAGRAFCTFLLYVGLAFSIIYPVSPFLDHITDRIFNFGFYCH